MLSDSNKHDWHLAKHLAPGVHRTFKGAGYATAHYIAKSSAVVHKCLVSPSPPGRTCHRPFGQHRDHIQRRHQCHFDRFWVTIRVQGQMELHLISSARFEVSTVIPMEEHIAERMVLLNIRAPHKTPRAAKFHNNAIPDLC